MLEIHSEELDHVVVGINDGSPVVMGGRDHADHELFGCLDRYLFEGNEAHAQGFED